MKSYSQGLITGGVLVFAIIVFMSASSKDTGRYQPCDSRLVLDTQTGTVYYEGKIRAKISEEMESTQSARTEAEIKAINDEFFKAVEGLSYEKEDDGLYKKITLLCVRAFLSSTPTPCIVRRRGKL